MMEKTKMPSKINPPRATPDQGSKGCCCRPSSKEQMGTLAEPLSGGAPVATSGESESAISPQPGGCCATR